MPVLRLGEASLCLSLLVLETALRVAVKKQDVWLVGIIGGGWEWVESISYYTL